MSKSKFMESKFMGVPIKDLRGFMRPAKVKKLLVTALNKSFRDYLLLRLLWVTGARASEILGDYSWYKDRIFEPAKVKDIDFEEENILLNLLKRSQYPPPKHIVPLDKKTLRELKQWITEAQLGPEDPLFGITRQRAFQIIRQTGVNAGIIRVGSKKLHLHHLRHSNAVAYIIKNNTMEGLRKLQERLGHANIGTTAHYLQFGLESRKETEEVFGDF